VDASEEVNNVHVKDLEGSLCFFFSFSSKLAIRFFFYLPLPRTPSWVGFKYTCPLISRIFRIIEVIRDAMRTYPGDRGPLG